MPITGINLKLCTNCGQCITECPMRMFRIDQTEKQIIFDDSEVCILCGHCIAVCPENAINFKDMKDNALDFETFEDPAELIPYDVMHWFLRAKRSVRQYQRKKIPTDLIEKVIDSMRYAPTGANMRMLKCVILSDDEQIKSLSDSSTYRKFTFLFAPYKIACQDLPPSLLLNTPLSVPIMIA